MAVFDHANWIGEMCSDRDRPTGKSFFTVNYLVLMVCSTEIILYRAVVIIRHVLRCTLQSREGETLRYLLMIKLCFKLHLRSYLT